jgi:hypothetical protein
MSGFADGWDPELAMELAPVWMERNLMRSALIEVEELVDVVDRVLRSGSSLSLPSVTVAARPKEDVQ